MTPVTSSAMMPRPQRCIANPISKTDPEANRNTPAREKNRESTTRQPQTEHQHDRPRAIFQLIHQLNAAPGNQHARTDQRRCIPEHPVKFAPTRQNNRSHAKEDQAGNRDRQRVGKPEHKPECRSDDADAQDDVDHQRDHCFSRPAGDFLGLRPVQNSFDDQAVGIDDMWHRQARYLNIVHRKIHRLTHSLKNFLERRSHYGAAWLRAKKDTLSQI